MTLKCITNQREMTMKKHKFRCCNGQKRTPSTELRTCMKTRSLLSFRCCIAQETNFKIIQKHGEFIPNARREAGQFEVYIHIVLSLRRHFVPTAWLLCGLPLSLSFHMNATLACNAIESRKLNVPTLNSATLGSETELRSELGNASLARTAPSVEMSQVG